MTNQTGYIVYATDSVGTALGEIEPGAIRLLGEPGDGHVTASRNVYGLYKLGYLETRGDGERVNYITRPDALERLFRWVLEYVSEQK